MSQTYYTPGVCNINDAEVSYRRLGGHLFTVGTLLLLLLMIVFRIEPVYALVIAIPAATAALQYLQVKNRFCTRFALQHKYSVSDSYKDSKRVTNTTDIERDKQRSVQLFIQAGLIGIGSALLSIVILNSI